MMTLDDAVNLVLHAFEHSRNGDMFVQKAPAATINTIAMALKEHYDSRSAIKIIGTRHGEKLFETLVNREEMVKATEEKSYFRIPADTRDLNYNHYYNEGELKVSQIEDYTSHNTNILNIEETKELLLQLPIVRQDVLGEDPGKTYSP